MQLIAPDVLTAARGLSAGSSVALVILGTLLWAFGWRYHRFWMVFGITLVAGVLGLSAGQAAGGQQVMVVGVLVAVAAGMLALELSKLLAFATGGVAAWVGVQALQPQATELWAVFLCGGLLGVVLYRLWTMLTTSLVGVFVAGHAGLTVAGGAWQFDAARWAADHTIELNGAAVAAAVLGVVVQAKTAPPVADATAVVLAADVENPVPTLIPASAEPLRGSGVWGRVRGWAA